MWTFTLLAMCGAAVLSAQDGGAAAQAETKTVVPSRSGADVRELPAPQSWRPGDPMIEGPPRRGTGGHDKSADSSSPLPGAAEDRPAGAAGACGVNHGAADE